ncbi:alpha/beta fold hydrolase [Rhizobium lentis]|uniref:Alpha/beta hydrolase n=1 Tax=Rhizobium lentis TaxID=1138194 RepID=A0ABS7IB81_9HYPH|nr:alpha/beta hydrolase [Rhizobium lentis]MBX5088370.1 alpha/beta hydrolase [Rhizobium lentis]
MLRNLTFLAAATLLALTNLSVTAAAADLKAKTIVLVHGAFADGTSWHKVIPLLEKAGLKVIAVQNPCESLAGDVAFTKRALRSAEGPVVLVGHSWGGVVVTEAGNDAKVSSLVYVAAYAPDSGQSAIDITSKYPQPKGRNSFIKDQDGFLKISDEGIDKYFAAGLTRAEKRIVAVVQGGFHVSAPATKVSRAAWREKPTFMVVATKDDIISPLLQKDQVALAKAKSVEVPSGHVAMLSHAREVADLILAAAR